MAASEPTGALVGRIAIVTGAASGIGRATAELFGREGAQVVLADVESASGEAAAREIAEHGGRAIFERVDVTEAADAHRLVERARQEFGALHVLVNSAGVMRRATVIELEEPDWDRVLAVNVKSIFLLSKHALPVMAASGGGSIINVASGWGLAGGPRAAAYCASKGAVVLLTKAMAIDHGPEKIRVNCVCPGDTDTPMLRGEALQLEEPEAAFLAAAARRPLGRVGTPQEIAQAILFLAGTASSFMTGAALVVDGGGLAGG
ncbi:MAG TPA: SDR family NAD(P)-dependent oxidoreductase [Terriglobia bacterium]|nr:SDR family NAD(P)-dependent oxidoreductase [Terriglobia bacterium]